MKNYCSDENRHKHPAFPPHPAAGPPAGCPSLVDSFMGQIYNRVVLAQPAFPAGRLELGLGPND